MQVSQRRIPPEIPPRRSIPGTDFPPVPSRWDLCSRHKEGKYTAICVTCVQFLCQKCLVSEIYFHQQCEVVYLTDDIVPACQKVNAALSVRMNEMTNSLTEFHSVLTKKRERMLKKRDQTLGEIERYFTRLKEKLLKKLRNDEMALLDIMKSKVNEQDEIIRQSIEQCNYALNTMAEKRTVLQHVERLCSSRRGGTSMSFMKNLVKTLEELKKVEQASKEASAVRDAFLVIRFYINSETEQLLLNKHIACLEVLSSASDNTNAKSLENESIIEAEDSVETSLEMTPNNAEMETDFKAEIDDGQESIDVDLPPEKKEPISGWGIDAAQLRVNLPVINSPPVREQISSGNESPEPHQENTVMTQIRTRSGEAFARISPNNDIEPLQLQHESSANIHHGVKLQNDETQTGEDFTQFKPMEVREAESQRTARQSSIGNRTQYEDNREARQTREGLEQTHGIADFVRNSENTRVLNTNVSSAPESQQISLADHSTDFAFADDMEVGEEHSSDNTSDQTELSEHWSRAENARSTPEVNSNIQSSENMIVSDERRSSNEISELQASIGEGTEVSSAASSEPLTGSTSVKRRQFDRSQSLNVVLSGDRDEASADNGESMHDDDPPPPYPGLPSSPVPTPGPNELPPPYSSGPPPPYSRLLLPRHVSENATGREGEPASSRRSLLSIRRLSEPELDSVRPDLDAPTQTRTPRLSRPRLEKVFSANEANDRRVSGVFSLTTVLGDNFLIVDRWNKKLKYFSSSGYSFGGLIFREEPWDVTEITDDLVAVTVPKLLTLYKVQVTGDSVLTKATVSTERPYACIAYNTTAETFICGQVPLFGQALIDVIGSNGGEIIQTFSSLTSHSVLQFSYPRYVKVSEDGTVIVCDWNLKCLIVFKLDGTLIGKYRGTVEFPLNEPTGITYNKATKEIYVIDAKHNSTHGAIHIITTDCRCKEIIRWDNEFRTARAVEPYGTGYVLSNKSGLMSIFTSRGRR